MAYHVRCFEVRGVDGVLYATLQLGEVSPPSTKAKPAKPYFGARVQLSRRAARAGSRETKLGVAAVNFAGELSYIPEGVSAAEIADLEAQIKAGL